MKGDLNHRIGKNTCSPSTRAVVVGGGLGGLAAAIALRRQGIEAVVFERAPELGKIQVGGAYALWYTGVRALQELGLADRISGLGTPIERFEFRTARGGALADWEVGPRGRELAAPPLGVMRGDLHRVLAEAVGADALRLGQACTGFLQDDAGVRAFFAGAGEERGDLLIGADGLASVIRTRLHGPAEPRYPGYGHWYGFLEGGQELAPTGIFRILYGGGARFAFLPVGGGRLCWWCTFKAGPTGDESGDDLKTKLLERFRGWAAPVEVLLEATPARAIARRNTFDLKPRRRWGEGRVTLLGDAAHPMTFNLGQGAASALKDGVMLAECLAGEPDVASALRRYERRRFGPTAHYVKRSRVVGMVDAWESRLGCFAHDRFLTRFPKLVPRELERDLDFRLERPSANRTSRTSRVLIRNARRTSRPKEGTTW